MTKVTNVLIFKDGYYWLTRNAFFASLDVNGVTGKDMYCVVTPNEFEMVGIDRNGFEFASDAYKYLAELDTKKRIAMVGDDDAKVGET